MCGLGFWGNFFLEVSSKKKLEKFLQGYFKGNRMLVFCQHSNSLGDVFWHFLMWLTKAFCLTCKIQSSVSVEHNFVSPALVIHSVILRTAALESWRTLLDVQISGSCQVYSIEIFILMNLQVVHMHIKVWEALFCGNHFFLYDTMPRMMPLKLTQYNDSRGENWAEIYLRGFL